MGNYADLTAFNVAKNAGQLNAYQSVGNAFILLSDGSLMTWSASLMDWFDAGDIRGPQGPQGEQGIQGPQGLPGGAFGNYGQFIYNHGTTLTSGVNSTATTLDVVSTTGFSSSGYLMCETEIIKYTSITPTSFIVGSSANRGVAQTTKAAHSSGANITSAQVTPIVGGNPVASEVQINTTDFSTGVTLSNSGTITVTNSGLYNFMFSIQFASGSNNDLDICFVWFRKNGQDIPLSSSSITIPTAHSGFPGTQLMTVNLFLPLLANDAVQLFWCSGFGAGVITTYPLNLANPIRPECPAVILTVNQIG